MTKGGGIFFDSITEKLLKEHIFNGLSGIVQIMNDKYKNDKDFKQILITKTSASDLLDVFIGKYGNIYKQMEGLVAADPTKNTEEHIENITAFIHEIPGIELVFAKPGFSFKDINPPLKKCQFLFFVAILPYIQSKKLKTNELEAAMKLHINFFKATEIKGGSGFNLTTAVVIIVIIFVVYTMMKKKPTVGLPAEPPPAIIETPSPIIISEPPSLAEAPSTLAEQPTVEISEELPSETEPPTIPGPTVIAELPTEIISSSVEFYARRKPVMRQK